MYCMLLSIWNTRLIFERGNLSFYLQNLRHAHQKLNYNIACVVRFGGEAKMMSLSIRNHSKIIDFKSIII